MWHNERQSQFNVPGCGTKLAQSWMTAAGTKAMGWAPPHLSASMCHSEIAVSVKAKKRISLWAFVDIKKRDPKIPFIIAIATNQIRTYASGR
jgi:hypothetical protein